MIPFGHAPFFLFFNPDLCFQETNLYPQAREHLQFLKSYAEHFNLRKYIRFSTRVTKLEKSPDHQETGKWRITSQKLGIQLCNEIYSTCLLL